MMSKYIKISVSLFLLFGSLAVAKAQENNEKNIQVVPKEVTGTVSGLTKNFIAVTEGVDNQTQAGSEFAFNIDKKVKIEHKRSLSDIRFGDTVTVKYDEETETLENSRKVRRLIAKTIAFVKAAPKELISNEGITAPQTGESDNGSLSLKGIKGR